MRERLLALAERRARLSARAQSERESMAALIARTNTVASLAVSLLHAARRVLEQGQRHPLIVVAGVALLIALRPRRAISWIAKGWSLWRLYRGARGWWLRFAAAGTTPVTPRSA